MKIKYIAKDEIVIRIYKSDYDKIINIKTIYDVAVVNYLGIEKVKRDTFENRYIIIFIILCLIILYFLSNVIFYVDVITNDSDMKNKLIMDLKEYGIEKYKLKKDYNKIQYIKKEIINKYKDKIEWMEIESIGTKYIIRYEPRVLSREKDIKENRNIIAKKDAVIKHLDISSGQIIRNINTYVKKGDVIVSGYINLNNSIKDTVSSSGTVYGEVWYKVTIDYPYKYYEEYKTGNKKKVFVFEFLNNDIELFNFKKYKSKFIENKTLIKNNLLPIKFVIQKQMETKKIEEKNTEKDLINKALKYSKEKIESTLNNNEYVHDYKILNKIKKESSIELNIFYSVIEDITEYQTIEEYSEEVE